MPDYFFFAAFFAAFFAGAFLAAFLTAMVAVLPFGYIQPATRVLQLIECIEV
ncbi:MAG TPA: hypothetical protein VGD59_10895 [Acidisarcina sp.]